MKKYFTLIILAVFILLTAVFYSLKTYAPEFAFPALMGGNVLMAVLSLITYFIVKKQINERPQAFVRGVYGATFLKLMICLVSLLVYVMVNKPDIHKPSLFILFGIYVIYTAVETALLTKLAKQQSN